MIINVKVKKDVQGAGKMSQLNSVTEENNIVQHTKDV